MIIEKISSFVLCQLLLYYDFSPKFVKLGVQRCAGAVFTAIFKLRRMVCKSELPFKIYYVRLNDVCHISQKTLNHDIFTKYWHLGVVKDGDWDQGRDKIDDDCLFVFSKQIFLENRPTEETDYYKRVLSGELERYIKTRAQFLRRIDHYRELYQRIKEHGYKSQDRIKNGNIFDEVCISIDRDGTYLLEDGRHRLFIAKLLGIREMPVILSKVHQQYWDRIEHDESLLVAK